MIRTVILAVACSVLNGACQTQYAEDPHSFLDITVHDGSSSEFLKVAERTARKHGLTVDRGEFAEARHHIYALRFEGREFAASVSNPHRPQEFVLATYLAATGARSPAGERQFVAEVIDEVVSQDLGRVSPRPKQP